MRGTWHFLYPTNEFPEHYKNHFIGKLKPDLIVEDTIIIELKVDDSFTPAHDAQLLGYLAITSLPLGLLLNFKVIPLGKRRILAPKNPLHLKSPKPPPSLWSKSPPSKKCPPLPSPKNAASSSSQTPCFSRTGQCRFTSSSRVTAK